MNAESQKTKYQYQKPAVYKIEVSGHLDTSWKERLAGMQITNDHLPDGSQVCFLIGRLNDQAALSGVLNALFDNRMSVISVNILDENSRSKPNILKI